jgi:hypothetical protein
MADYKNLFTRFLDRNDIKYSEPKDNVVKVVYTGDNLKTIPIFVFFDADGDPLVSLKCWEIANFRDEKYASGIIACNDLNKEYRWVCFYIDDDHDVVAQIDAYVDEETCGNICTSLVKRMVNIIDDGYPKIMEALWSRNS